MLIARRAKRDAKTRFARDARADLIEDGEAIGAIAYAIGPETATITVRGETYRAGRARPRKDEVLYRLAIRLARGGKPPPPNPIQLTNSAGCGLGEALETGRRTLIRMGDEKFEFRRRPLFHAASISLARAVPRRSARPAAKACFRRSSPAICRLRFQLSCRRSFSRCCLT